MSREATYKTNRLRAELECVLSPIGAEQYDDETKNSIVDFIASNKLAVQTLVNKYSDKLSNESKSDNSFTTPLAEMPRDLRLSSVHFKSVSVHPIDGIEYDCRSNDRTPVILGTVTKSCVNPSYVFIPHHRNQPLLTASNLVEIAQFLDYLNTGDTDFVDSESKSGK